MNIKRIEPLNKWFLVRFNSKIQACAVKRKRHDYMATIFAVLIIAVSIFLAWVIYTVKILPILLLVLLPIISYKIRANRMFSESDRKTVQLGIFATTLFIAMIFLFNRREQVGFYTEPIVDGRYEEREVLIEPDEGTEYEQKIRAYIPKSKKGKKAMDIIEWVLVLISFGSVYVSFRVISNLEVE